MYSFFFTTIEWVIHTYLDYSFCLYLMFFSLIDSRAIEIQYNFTRSRV
jgi:hypothetical protein